LHPETGQRNLDWLTWGLLPHATENPGGAPAPIHARAESVAELPMFADAFRQRRAIVPATEYYQRRTIGGSGRYAVARRDGRPLAIAGLWNAFRRSDGESVRTYCITPIHDRMLLVLDEPDWPVWLGEVAGDPATLLRPPTDDTLVLRPIHSRTPPAPHQ
jgi:putative SOS response-associated peptidase YedK